MTERCRTATVGKSVSRRGVLRVAGAAGAGLLGTVVASRPAAATYCPRSADYWANHEWPDSVPELTLGGRTMDPAEWRGFLLESPGEDKAHAMAKQLVAAALNGRFRAPSDPNCVDRKLDALDGRSVRDVIARAEGWLNWSSFDEASKQTSWELRMVVDGEETVVDGEPLRDTLERYNRGQFYQLDCGCDDREPPTDRTSDREDPPAMTSESDGSDEGTDGQTDSPDHSSLETLSSPWEWLTPVGPW